jgi:hypothetical protein
VSDPVVDRYVDVWRRAYWAHREVPGRHRGECCQDRCWSDIGRRVLDEMVPKVQAWLGEPEAQPATGTEALRAALLSVAHIYRRQHDDECNCEGCNAYEAATDEVEPTQLDTAALAIDEERVARALRILRDTRLGDDEGFPTAMEIRAALEAARPVSSEGSARSLERPIIYYPGIPRQVSPEEFKAIKRRVFRLRRATPKAADR